MKNFLDRTHILRRSQQAGTPLRKNRRDLVSVFFSNKVIAASLGFQEQSIERPEHPIVRMQVELTIRWGCVCRIKTVECGPAETAQTCGIQRRGGSLKETNQKVAPTKVHGA